MVTNGTLTNITFALGDGGRLQIDAGGSVTGITSFVWRSATVAWEFGYGNGGRVLDVLRLVLASNAAAAFGKRIRC